MVLWAKTPQALVQSNEKGFINTNEKRPFSDIKRIEWPGSNHDSAGGSTPGGSHREITVKSPGGPANYFNLVIRRSGFFSFLVQIALKLL